MCGRYFYDSRTKYEIDKDLNLDMGEASMKSGDVTPSMKPVVLTAVRGNTGSAANGDIRIADMFWGIAGKDKKLVINARAESVMERPMFADSFEHRRCVMPAAGFYEWDRDKNKVTFFNKDKSPIYLAGFYQLTDNHDSFVILTIAANESMIKIHDRMPLMIDKSEVRNWLYDREAAIKMLTMSMPLLDSYRDYEQLSLF